MRVIGTFIATAVALVALLNACAPQRTILEQVLSRGELHVLTRNAGTTYYQGPFGPDGLEYQLMTRFAEHLGVSLKITVPDNFNDILTRIKSGDAHVAAAGLTITEERARELRFAPPYQTITQQIIYNANSQRPKSVADLNGMLEVIAKSAHTDRLNALKSEYPQLSWVENDEVDTSELLTLVAEQIIDYTVADSNEVDFNRRYYPELRVAFDVTEPQQLAWAFPRTDDDSLYNEAVTFFNSLRENGELARILATNYQHVNNYDFAGTRTFLAQVRNRLPRYRGYFEEAAETYDLDWRLLAALAYQESHWRPHAVSHTGVRGMMMLTQMTADWLEVSDRTDPKESIDAGARYLRNLIDRVPPTISESDRVWVALAAYNVGLGHVEDARRLAETRGENPNNWINIKATLPLLANSKWYKQTRYGYARGWEPVRYVDNIRSYYDILAWHLEKDAPVFRNLGPILAYSSSAL